MPPELISFASSFDEKMGLIASTSTKTAESAPPADSVPAQDAAVAGLEEGKGEVQAPPPQEAGESSSSQDPSGGGVPDPEIPDDTPTQAMSPVGEFLEQAILTSPKDKDNAAVCAPLLPSHFCPDLIALKN